MTDITLTPIVACSTKSELTMEFKVRCNDTTLLDDIKKNLSVELVNKDFKVLYKKGWYETK